MTHDIDFIPRPQFRVGLFWFVGERPRASRIMSLLRPFDQAPQKDGLISLTQTHEDVWPELQRIDRAIQPYSFDYFPRGRLDYFAPGRRWLLFLDPKLNHAAVIARLALQRGITRGHLTVKSDPSYVSHARIKLKK